MALQALENDADSHAMYQVLAQTLEQAARPNGDELKFAEGIIDEPQHAVEICLMCGIVMLGTFWQPSGSVEQWPGYDHPPAGVRHLLNFAAVNATLNHRGRDNYEP